MTPPATFPACRDCPRFATGPPRLCLTCARSQLDLVTGGCPVCSQLLDGNGVCPNELCRTARRRIARIHAVAYQGGPLRRVINDYKYRGGAHWPVILGRLLLAWLDETMTADRPDLIVANPSFVGAGGQRFAHTEAVLAAAAAQDRGRWPFDRGEPAAIIKTGPTPRSADEPRWYKQFAAADLRSALRVPDPARIAGKFVLVYDDVCTTGRQLDTVAAALLDDGGATRVEGVVLGRAPWHRRS